MVDCIECKNFRECQSRGELTGRLTSCLGFQQKPKTNADHIRAMSNEELAEFLAAILYDSDEPTAAEMLVWLEATE